MQETREWIRWRGCCTTSLTPPLLTLPLLLKSEGSVRTSLEIRCTRSDMCSYSCWGGWEKHCSSLEECQRRHPFLTLLTHPYEIALDKFPVSSSCKQPELQSKCVRRNEELTVSYREANNDWGSLRFFFRFSGYCEALNDDVCSFDLPLCVLVSESYFSVILLAHFPSRVCIFKLFPFCVSFSEILWW